MAFPNRLETAALKAPITTEMGRAFPTPTSSRTRIPWRWFGINKRIKGNMRKMRRDLVPVGGNDVTDLAENAATIPGADGYEVGGWSRVVKA
jgi:hypothetical protein